MPGFDGLKYFAQFIPYRLQQDGNKLKKFPIDPRGYQTDHTNRANWHTFDACEALAKRLGPNVGIAFELTEDDPYWFLDIDDCATETGWTPEANALCAELQGAAIEISSSGNGLHIVARGRVPPHGCVYNTSTLKCELYTSLKPISLTFNSVIGDVDIDLTSAITRIATQYFPPHEYKLSDWTEEPRPEWNGPLEDDALIEKALRSESHAAAFGSKASFRQLWEADPIALSKFYNNNRSDADLALAYHLAFWTGCNCERIKSIMWQSSLARDKWDTDIHKSYLKNTILKAVGNQTKVYTGSPRTVSSLLPNGAPTLAVFATGARLTIPRQGSRLLMADDQKDLFAGCVYVRDQHVALVPGGDQVTPEQFRVTYGGYSFRLDSLGEKKPTSDAWKAFTESQMVLHPQAHGVCFRPDLPPAAIITEYGRLLANSWTPQHIPRKQGDPTPFLNHLKKLVPDANDREILINYAASVVQLQGRKFTWCPLIQGAPGNGKTLFTKCILKAVGPKYSHKPTAASLLEQFNTFLKNTVFIGVEEIHIPAGMAEDKYMDKIKSMITDDDFSIRAMRTDHKMHSICCNFLFNSNHLDALPKTRDDRRLCVIYTAQQSVDDLWRDDMMGDYFPNLMHWLDTGGYEIMSEFLWTYPLTPLPNRAPDTTSTPRALKTSLNPMVQEIAEQIEQGTIGFKYPWVSSIALDNFIENLKLPYKPSQNKRRELLQSLGYDWPTHLPEGRSTRLIEGKRPKLYVKLDHPAAMLQNPAEISESYLKSQNAV